MKRKLLLTLTAVLLLTGCSSKISSESVENSLSSTVSEETIQSSNQEQSSSSEGQEESTSDVENETKPNNQNFDYKSLFKDKSTPYLGEDKFDVKMEYQYNKIQDKSVLPFENSEFSKVSASLYCDENEAPEYLIIKLSNEGNGKELKIIINANGYYNLNTDGETPVTFNGIDVFGYTTNCYDSDLELYFKVENKAYGLRSIGLSYNELGKILADILNDDIPFDIFATTESLKINNLREILTFEDMKNLETFKGKIKLQNIRDMLYVQSDYYNYFTKYENGVKTYERLHMYYRDSKVVNKVVEINYTTSRDDGFNLCGYEFFKPSEVTPEVIRDNILQPGEEGINRYTFNVDCGSFYLGIDATCTEEEVLIFIDSIKN